MKYALELQEELFGLFINDSTVCSLLSITDNTNLTDCSNKIRKGIQTATTVNDSPNLFLSYFVVPSYGIETGNYLANTRVIEFDLYGKYRGKITQLFKAVNTVLKSNYEDMKIVSEGYIESPATGIYAYMFRVKPLVST